MVKGWCTDLVSRETHDIIGIMVVLRMTMIGVVVMVARKGKEGGWGRKPGEDLHLGVRDIFSYL